MNELQYDPYLFAEFFDWQPQAIVWLEPIWDEAGRNVVDFRYTYCNPMGLQYLHLTSSQIGQVRISNTPSLTDEMRTAILKEMIRVLQTGITSETNIYNPVINKYARVFRIRFRNGILTIVQDSSEENKAIRELSNKTVELAQQKEFTDSILDASLNGIYVLEAMKDAAGTIADFVFVRCNKQFAELTGWTVEQVAGKSFLSLFPQTKENGLFTLLSRVLESGNAQSQALYHAQAFNRWYDYVAVRLGENKVVVTFQEVTKQREHSIQIEKQKALLDNLLKHSSNGISVSEAIRDQRDNVIDARTILANDAAVKYTGLPKDIYLEKSATEIDPNIVQTPYFQMCIRTLQTGEPFITQYLLEATGRWLELTVSRMDKDHLIHNFTDITPIKEAQLQLEQSVRELKRSNENLEEFAYVASHDLQEPLRKISTFSDRLKEGLAGQLNPSQKNLFERIESATLRMRDLINDLLQYSRLSRKEEVFETVNLTEVINGVIQDFEARINETGASIQVDELPEINGDERQLRQMFQNLIGNALKYRKEDTPPAISVRCKMLAEDDPLFSRYPEVKKAAYNLISVSDNGIGFEQDDAQKIFKVFQRLHGRSEYEGTGIGLAIVQKVVTNHNGYIVAESSPGKGATFLVFLPV